MGGIDDPFDYVAVGHVTRDVVLASGREQAGGGALYSGLQAARLGRRTLIVTAGVPAEIEALCAPFAGEIELRVHPAAETTCFEAVGVDAQRRLRLSAWAGPIPMEEPVSASIVHLAPVAMETSGAPAGEERFTALTPQGLVRSWGSDGEVRLREIDLRTIPERCDAIVLGGAEIASARPLIDRVIAAGGVVSVTHGAAGAEARRATEAVRVEAPAALDVVEDLGAGDVYAAAFFIALHDGAALEDAIARGQAAALVRLSGAGAAAVGDAAAIDQASASASSPESS